MKTTRIKIFQKSSYHEIERDFNAWAVGREEKLQTLQDVAKEDVDLLQIPPTVLLSFDQSLQKYILTVTYFEVLEDLPEG